MKFAANFLFLLASFSLVASEGYSLEDLQVLSEQKNYREFLENAKDIKPSLRNERWRELVQNMAIAFLEFNIRLKNFDEEEDAFIQKISKWPLLREDEFFQGKHSVYKLAYTSHCFKLKRKNCALQAKKFWNLSIKDPENRLPSGENDSRKGKRGCKRHSP